LVDFVNITPLASAIDFYRPSGIGVDNCLWPHLHGEAKSVTHIASAPNGVPSEPRLIRKINIRPWFLNSLRVTNPEPPHLKLGIVLV
jgi:hypothetical protein